ncbi:MAG: GTP-binding protein [Betaproteobacteria bacterium]|nr:GTP-binding protein [Betaproteobacteria bacterium]
MTDAGDLPLVVIGGYLGAGKTTLVNRWLREARASGLRIAVLVNDFGEVGIDADLIVTRRDDVIELAGGCVCCSFGSDLVAALGRLHDRQPRPDAVLLETSGVALPGTVAATARLARGFAVDEVIVLADLNTVRERAADTYVGDTVLRQIARADRLLLTRDDLVDGGREAAVRAWLTGIAPGVPLALAREAPLPFAPAAPPAEPTPTPTPTPRPAPIRGRPRRPGARPAGDARLAFDSVSARFAGPVDLADLAHALADPGLGLERAKGIVQGPGDRPWAVELAGGSVSVSPAPAAEPGDPLTATDPASPAALADPPAAPAGRLVFIGVKAQINRAALVALIERLGGQPL